jgi:hypothetical protein
MTIIVIDGVKYGVKYAHWLQNLDRNSCIYVYYQTQFLTFGDLDELLLIRNDLITAKIKQFSKQLQLESMLGLANFCCELEQPLIEHD